MKTLNLFPVEDGNTFSFFISCPTWKTNETCFLETVERKRPTDTKHNCKNKSSSKSDQPNHLSTPWRGGTAPLEPELFARSWSNSSAKMKISLTLFLKQKMDFNWSCKALVLNCEVVGLNLVPSYLNDIWNWKAYFFIICKLCAAQNTVNYVIFMKHQPT